MVSAAVAIAAQSVELLCRANGGGDRVDDMTGEEEEESGKEDETQHKEGWLTGVDSLPGQL